MPSRHPLHRARPGALAIVALVALLGACSTSTPTDTDAATDGPANTVGTTLSAEAPTTESPVAGGSLTYGVAADANSLNPAVGQWAGTTYLVANAIYEPLFALGVDGTASPYLAERATSNVDFTEWTIGLRDGISFHDGTPFDADAVAANLEAGLAAPLLGQLLEPIDSVAATDARTVVVTMNEPWSTFPETLTAQVGYMSAPSMTEAENPATTDPIGTGPFVFESHVPGSIITVTKNADYWQDGKPYLDDITYKVIPDDVSRAAAMEAGDLDAMEVTTTLVLKDVLAASAAGELQLLTNAGLEANEFVMALNTSKPPFDDPIARQALAYAIDQEELSETVYEGVWPGAWGNFEEGSPFFISKEEAGYPEPDPAKAQELAAKYEEAHGAPLSFTFQLGTDSQAAVLGQHLQQTLAAVGITVSLQQTEQATSIANIFAGTYEAGYFAMFSAPTLDKGYFFVATEPAASGLSLNYTRLADPEITAAMNGARTTTDQAQQVDDYAVVQKQMAENLDRIFLFHARTAVAFDNDVHGFTTATFPGTDVRAFAPDITFPFTTDLWKAT